ncbi:MAG: hypothetical protein MAG431_01754 [Chloroflexi bacterium]|nr:hypothetical protein [Chloroflexota bacterium]
MPEIIPTLAVALVFLTAFSLLLFENWRLSIGALALQYTGAFLLVAQSWPMQIAVVKLVAGWMSVAVFGMALIDHFQETEQETILNLPGRLFRTLVAILVGLVIISLLPDILNWFLGATLRQGLGGAFLLGLGLLHLGLSTSPGRVIIGLLTVISGFEVVYAAVETSILLTSLLAVVNLGIAFVGAYLLSLSSLDIAEEIGE